jgi:serine/threonine protein phosphatase PrpC
VINKEHKLAIHGVTDVGLSRDHNEDSIGWDGDLGLVILADGMGGHNAGEIASEMAVSAIRDALQDVLTPELLETNVIDMPSAVRESIIFANEEINSAANTRTECAGMGTTVVLLLFHNHQVTYANVGDSRIYRLRDGELKQITSDHSLVQEMVDNGYLSEEEALLSSSRNLITRALGIAQDVEVDVVTDEYNLDDVYLLCSDGLTDMVSDEEIKQVLMEAENLDHAATRLVELANEYGGSDNISVILVALHEAFSDERGLPPGTSQEIQPDDA